MYISSIIHIILQLILGAFLGYGLVSHYLVYSNSYTFSPADGLFLRVETGQLQFDITNLLSFYTRKVAWMFPHIPLKYLNRYSRLSSYEEGGPNDANLDVRDHKKAVFDHLFHKAPEKYNELEKKFSKVETTQSFGEIYSNPTIYTLH